MLWWLRSRLDRGVLALLGVGVVMVPLLGGQDRPVPRLGIGPAPYALLLPALAAAALVGATQKGHFVYEATSRRPIGWLILGFNLTGLAVVAGLWSLTAAPGGDAMSFSHMAIRNLAGYVGTGLVVLRLAGGAVASAAPVLYAVIVAVLGSSTAGVWSWPLYAATSPGAAVFAIMLLISGLVVATSPASLRKLARTDLYG